MRPQKRGFLGQQQPAAWCPHQDAIYHGTAFQPQNDTMGVDEVTGVLAAFCQPSGSRNEPPLTKLPATGQYVAAVAKVPCPNVKAFPRQVTRQEEDAPPRNRVEEDLPLPELLRGGPGLKPPGAKRALHSSNLSYLRREWLLPRQQRSHAPPMSTTLVSFANTPLGPSVRNTPRRSETALLHRSLSARSPERQGSTYT